MRSIFATIGCDVRLAANGGEAIEIATARAFDLMLMDRHMPRYDATSVSASSGVRMATRAETLDLLQIPSAPVAAPDP